MGDDATAEVTLRRAIQVDPGLGRAYVALGVLLVTTGRNAEGIDVLKRAVELDATNFDALFNLTKTLFDVGRYDEAHTYGDQFLATAPPAREDDIATIKKLLGKAAGSHVYAPATPAEGLHAAPERPVARRPPCCDDRRAGRGGVATPRTDAGAAVHRRITRGLYRVAAPSRREPAGFRVRSRRRTQPVGAPGSDLPGPARGHHR